MVLAQTQDDNRICPWIVCPYDYYFDYTTCECVYDYPDKANEAVPMVGCPYNFYLNPFTGRCVPINEASFLN